MKPSTLILLCSKKLASPRVHCMRPHAWIARLNVHKQRILPHTAYCNSESLHRNVISRAPSLSLRHTTRSAGHPPSPWSGNSTPKVAWIRRGRRQNRALEFGSQ